MAVMPEIRRVAGPELEPYLTDLAALRIRIFRDYPYLYDGNVEYESAYLRRFGASHAGVIVLALVDDAVVGASTGMPLAEQAAAFCTPWRAAGLDPQTVFYGGESVLLPQYRGGGVYRQFFLERESYARQLGGFDTFAFCAVVRDAAHSLQPGGYGPLDPVWTRYGYTKHPELVASLAWKGVDEPAESDKSLVFWLKPLASAARVS